MAVSKGGVTASPSFSFVPASGAFSGQTLNDNLALSVLFANGTGTDNGNLIYQNTLTFVASTPQTLNMQTLVDPLGNAQTWARVKMLAVRVNGTTDAATLTLSPNASNGWTSLVATSSSLVLRAASAANTTGSYALFSAPGVTCWTVGSSNKSLDLTPSAHAFTVDLLVYGCDT